MCCNCTANGPIVELCCKYTATTINIASCAATVAFHNTNAVYAALAVYAVFVTATFADLSW